MAESLVIDHNLSLMAVDKSNNSTKAVMLNGAFDRAEIDVSREEVIESCIDKKFVPIASILHEVQIKGRQIFYEKNIETAFDLKMLAVDPDTRGLGLAREMIQRSVDLARCLGYKMCKTEATGDYSRSVFSTTIGRATTRLGSHWSRASECCWQSYAIKNRLVASEASWGLLCLFLAGSL